MSNAGQWWITTGVLALGGEKILGPFATQELAMEVRRYMEIVRKPVTFWVDQDDPPAELADAAKQPAGTQIAEG